MSFKFTFSAFCLCLLISFSPAPAFAQTEAPLTTPDYATLSELIRYDHDEAFVAQLCAEVEQYALYSAIETLQGFTPLLRCDQAIAEQGFLALLQNVKAPFLTLTSASDCFKVAPVINQCLSVSEPIAHTTEHTRWLLGGIENDYVYQGLIFAIDVANQTGEITAVQLISKEGVGRSRREIKVMDLDQDGAQDFVLINHYESRGNLKFIRITPYLAEAAGYTQQERLDVRSYPTADAYDLINAGSMTLLRTFEQNILDYGCEWVHERVYTFTPAAELVHEENATPPASATCYLAQAMHSEDPTERKQFLEQALRADVDETVINRQDFYTLVSQQLAFWYADAGDFTRAQQQLNPLNTPTEATDTYTAAVMQAVATTESFLESCAALQALDADVNHTTAYHWLSNSGSDFAAESARQWSPMCNLQHFTQRLLATNPLLQGEDPQAYLSRLDIPMLPWTVANLDQDAAEEWLTVLRPTAPIVVLFDQTANGWTIQQATLSTGHVTEINVLEDDADYYIEIAATLTEDGKQWTRTYGNDNYIGAPVYPGHPLIEIPDVGSFYITAATLLAGDHLEQSGDYFATLADYQLYLTDPEVTKVFKCGCGGWGGIPPHLGADVYRQAYQSEMAGDYALAAVRYQQVLLTFPDSPFAMLAKAHLSGQVRGLY